jgi:hypothetical protein
VGGSLGGGAKDWILNPANATYTSSGTFLRTLTVLVTVAPQIFVAGTDTLTFTYLVTNTGELQYPGAAALTTSFSGPEIATSE